jgi:hypothetical protein
MAVISCLRHRIGAMMFHVKHNGPGPGSQDCSTNWFARSGSSTSRITPESTASPPASRSSTTRLVCAHDDPGGRFELMLGRTPLPMRLERPVAQRYRPPSAVQNSGRLEGMPIRRG